MPIAKPCRRACRVEMTGRSARTPIARLRRIRDAAAAGMALGDDGPWLAAGLDAYLRRAPEGLTLPAALELAVPVGGAPWWRIDALARRDDALRRLAAEHYSSLPPSERAAAIGVSLRRYASTSWPRDRHFSACPSRLVGTSGELLFAIMSVSRAPMSDRQIARIIDDSRA